MKSPVWGRCVDPRPVVLRAWRSPLFPMGRREPGARGGRLLLKEVPWLPSERLWALLHFSEELLMEGPELSGRMHRSSPPLSLVLCCFAL